MYHINNLQLSTFNIENVLFILKLYLNILKLFLPFQAKTHIKFANTMPNGFMLLLE